MQSVVAKMAPAPAIRPRLLRPKRRLSRPRSPRTYSNSPAFVGLFIFPRCLASAACYHGIMLKLIVIAAAVGGFFLLTPAGKQITNQLTTQAISVINPAAAERDSLSNLSGILNKMSNTVNSTSFQRATGASQVKQLNNLLDSAQGALDSAQTEAQKGDTASTLNALIQKVIPPSQPATPTSCPASR